MSVQTVQYQNEYWYERHFVGQVEARQSALLGFEISGRLKTITYNEGDNVIKGDVLAEIDTARLQARTHEADANLIRARADAKLAKTTYQRIQAARLANAVSDQEMDEAREARNTTAAAVKVAEAQHQSIRVDVEKSRLIAPFDGTVVRRMADEGFVVNTAQAILEVQQDSDYDIRMGVSHEVAKSLAVSDTKKVNINGQEYLATITTILPVRGQTRTVDVILKLQQRDTQIRPGDVVQLPLNYRVTTSGFWIPLTALKEGRRGLWSLYIVDNQLITERRAVEVHYTNGDQAFVSGSVKDGEVLITQGAAKLVPGQQVRLLEVDNDA
ncbi:MAG: efflux RND transporter periplasmic adaptor subunit [Arenicella sp.]